MTNLLRRAGQGIYWWVVRRKNNLLEILGFSSYPDLKEFQSITSSSSPLPIADAESVVSVTI